MIEFVYQMGKDTPEALAQELFNQQREMNLNLEKIGVETIAKNIRQSVDLAVNRRQSRAKQRSLVSHHNSRKRTDSTNSIFEVAGDKLLQQDPVYRQIYKSYQENLAKIYENQRQRKERKQESFLKEKQAEISELKEDLKKIEQRIINWGKITEDR